MVGVGERRNITQVDTGDGQRPTAVKRSQRRRHERSDRRKEDRRVEWLRRLVVRAARTHRAKFERETLSFSRTGEDVHAGTGRDRDLRREMGRGAEAIDPETPADR